MQVILARGAGTKELRNLFDRAKLELIRVNSHSG